MGNLSNFGCRGTVSWYRASRACFAGSGAMQSDGRLTFLMLTISKSLSLSSAGLRFGGDLADIFFLRGN